MLKMEVTTVTARCSRQPNAAKRTCIEIIIIMSSIICRTTHSPPTPMTTGPAKLRLLSLKRSTVAMPGPPWITISSWLLQRWRRNRIRNYKFIPLKRGVGELRAALIARRVYREAMTGQGCKQHQQPVISRWRLRRPGRCPVAQPRHPLLQTPLVVEIS